jgi:hypothetical protein
VAGQDEDRFSRDEAQVDLPAVEEVAVDEGADFAGEAKERCLGAVGGGEAWFVGLGCLLRRGQRLDFFFSEEGSVDG